MCAATKQEMHPASWTLGTLIQAAKRIQKVEPSFPDSNTALVQDTEKHGGSIRSLGTLSTEDYRLGMLTCN